MAKKNFLITVAVEADIAAIAPLFNQYRKFYKQEDDLPMAISFLAEQMSGNNSIFLLAKTEGVAVGFLRLYEITSSISTDKVVVVNDLFVSDSHRQNKIGELLLSAAINLSIELGARSATLQTQAENVIAMSLYKKIGFLETTEFISLNKQL